jgi:hypothetical protein
MLLAPFAWMGTDAFYWVARFLPPFFGVAAVAGTFMLGRHGLGPWGGLAAAAAIALMPEHIRRTNILFPTGLDLALLPFVLLFALHAAEGHRAALLALPAAAAGMLFVHPWFVILLLPPVGTFLLVRYLQRSRNTRLRAPITAGVASTGVLGLFVLFNPVWDPLRMLKRRAWPRFLEIVQDPSRLTKLPAHVDLAAMLTWPAIILGLAGTVFAIRRPKPFAILALLWTFLLLPIVLVNWFGFWYLPHRTVAYMATGVAMLVGIAVVETLQFVADRPAAFRRRAAVGAVAVVALLMLPAAAATPQWYRLYDQDDYDAWEAAEARGAPLVMAGSWETRAGYRALTGGPSGYYPSFFYDYAFRQEVIRNNPDLIVIISERTEKNGLPTEFLEGDSWEPIGEWGDVRAFARADGPSATAKAEG